MTNIRKVLFVGSKNLGLNCLEAMVSVSKESLCGVLTVDDSDDKRSVLPFYRSFCERNNIKLSIAKNKAHSETIITEEQPDLCIVIGWYWLFSKEILQSVPNGFIGLHNSLLPKYRGGSPLVWNIINGEKTMGFSIFSFTEGMDDGVIFYQYSYKPDPHHDIADILIHLENAAADALKDNYLLLLNGKLKPYAQNHEDASYCAQRAPEDGLINWNKPAQDIFNFIRAQASPYPGAFSFYKNEKLIIWRAKLDNRIFYGTPGQVAGIDSNGVLIMCGDNRGLLLKEVQLGTKKGQSFDFIKSIKARLNSGG